MNTICTITGQQYRNAFLCRKTDKMWNTINFLHISTLPGITELVSTNGHIMYHCPINPGDAIRTITFEPIKIPANVQTVTISEHSDTQVKIECVDKQGLTSTALCNIVDAQYLNYRAVIDSKIEAKPYTQFGFDPVYLALLAKIFPKQGVKFTMPCNTSGATVTCNIDDLGALVIMPLSLNKVNKS